MKAKADVQRLGIGETAERQTAFHVSKGSEI